MNIFFFLKILKKGCWLPSFSVPFTSNWILVLSCPVLSCPVLPCNVPSYLILSHTVMSCSVPFCHVSTVLSSRGPFSHIPSCLVMYRAVPYCTDLYRRMWIVRDQPVPLPTKAWQSILVHNYLIIKKFIVYYYFLLWENPYETILSLNSLNHFEEWHVILNMLHFHEYPEECRHCYKLCPNYGTRSILKRTVYFFPRDLVTI